MFAYYGISEYIIRNQSIIVRLMKSKMFHQHAKITFDIYTIYKENGWLWVDFLLSYFGTFFKFQSILNLFFNLESVISFKIFSGAYHNNCKEDHTFKEAYLFKSRHTQKIHWAKTIWSKDIPPSKSLIAWRIMQDKMLTDEKLREKGCNLPSICNLCLRHEETTLNLFFDCSFAIRMWTWLSATINLNLHFNNVEDIWRPCDRRWIPRCKIVIKVTIVNTLATIWFVRNQARFNNKLIQWKSAINFVSSSVTLTGNNTNLTSSSSMIDFQILKKFNIYIHPPKALEIKEVIWYPRLSRHDNKTHTRGYPPKPNSIWRVFPVLTGFGFFSISKHGYGTGNKYIGTHPKVIPKPVSNAKNYFMLICHVILFDNCRVIKITIDI